MPNDKMPSSILLVARFIVSAAKGAFFSIRDDRQATSIEALIAQKIEYRTRPFFSEHKIIVIRSALVAVPFYHEFIPGIFLQPLRSMEQSFTRRTGHGRTIVAKKNVLQPGKGRQSFSSLTLLRT